MQLKPAAENLLVRISRGPSTGITLSSDTQSYRIALSLLSHDYVEFVRRSVVRTTTGARWLVRLTGKGEQAAARIIDSRVDEINRSEPV